MRWSLPAVALGAAAITFAPQPHQAIDFAQSIGVVSLSSAAQADPVASAAPTAPGVVLCDVVLGLIAPIDPDGTGASSRYALALYAADSDAATASGTLALYSASERYDVSFDNVNALSPGNHAARTSVVVQLSEPIRIERGNVVSVSGPTGGTCAPFTAWNPPQSAADAANAQHVAVATYNAKLLQAATGVPFPASRCAGSDAPPTVVHAAQVDGPGYAWSRDLHADVAIVIDDDGSVGGATIYHSSGAPAFDLIALAQARESTYAPGIQRCRRTGGIYLFNGTLKAI
jgi:hypothetical protein